MPVEEDRQDSNTFLESQSVYAAAATEEKERLAAEDEVEAASKRATYLSAEMDVQALITAAAKAAGDSAAASIRTEFGLVLEGIRSEIGALKSGQTSLEDRMAEQERRMEALEKAPKASPSSAPSNASSDHATNSSEVTYIEVKVFYDWDSKTGEVEDTEVHTWIESLFKSTDAKYFFDVKACLGSALQRVSHRSFRLYFDSEFVKTKSRAHQALGIVKKYASSNSLNGRETFATFFDAQRTARNQVTGKALGVFKQHVDPDLLRTEWVTQTIYVKRHVPKADKTLKLTHLKLVHYSRETREWKVDDSGFFSEVVGEKLTPEAFLEEVLG